ncbi:MAG: hypothetical protein ACOY46_19890 [Bacillota bacterium]
MPPDEIMTALINAMQEDIRELKDQIKDMRRENSENIRRLHQRFDDLVQKDPVSRKECEQCRRDCPKGGYPAWVAVLFSLCVGLAVYVVTKGGH